MNKHIPDPYIRGWRRHDCQNEAPETSPRHDIAQTWQCVGSALIQLVTWRKDPNMLLHLRDKDSVANLYSAQLLLQMIDEAINPDTTAHTAGERANAKEGT